VAAQLSRLWFHSHLSHNSVQLTIYSTFPVISWLLAFVKRSGKNKQIQDGFSMLENVFPE
jgi:hypothetical protein